VNEFLYVRHEADIRTGLHELGQDIVVSHVYFDVLDVTLSPSELIAISQATAIPLQQPPQVYMTHLGQLYDEARAI